MKYPNYLFEYIEDNKRLRAELAELKSWMDDNDDSFVAELHEARAETGRLRVDHARTYANTVALAKACGRLRAELDETSRQRDEARRVADEIAVEREAAWAAIARVRELCELVIRDRDSGVGVEDVLAVIERNEK